jgi:hypothetical protein
LPAPRIGCHVIYGLLCLPAQLLKCLQTRLGKKYIGRGGREKKEKKGKKEKIRKKTKEI